MSSKPKTVFFVGIGGIGMSALARYYKATNWSISGSDLQDSKILKELRKEGMRVRIGHNKRHVTRNTGQVIYNQAISESNPELKEARKRGILLLSYPEAVGELTKQYKTIAIAGAHGKSTTTALVSHILINAGFDPTVIIGTRVKEFNNTNFRMGNSYEVQPRKSLTRLNLVKWLVLEADEYGYAFHHYSPFAAVITNIDKEHLDTYKNLSGVKKSFLKFISNVQDEGILILNEADKNLKSLEREIKKIAKKKSLNIFWYTQNSHISGLVSLGLSPALIGAHNISNATGACTLAKALGIPDQSIYNTLKNFSGTWRRLEYRGLCQLSDVSCQMSVYDDYAHHPTEIRASLAALRQANSKSQILNSKQIQNHNAQTPNGTISQLSAPTLGRSPDLGASGLSNVNGQRSIICVFQPHQTERLAALFNDFVDAFKDADALVLLPVYQVAGRERRTSPLQASLAHGGNIELRTVNSESLARAIQKKYPQKPVTYLRNPKNLKKILCSSLTTHHLLPTTHSVLVLMGAGDIVKWTDLLIKKA